MVDPYIYYANFSTEYKAVLNKAIQLGYQLPSVNQQKLQDDLMRSWITTGVFAKADLIYVFANDAGLDFGRINWKDPNNFLLTNTGTQPVGFLKNYGAYSNTQLAGVYGALDPGWSPSIGINFTQNSNSIIGSTKSYYGASGFVYRAGLSTSTTMFYSVDFIRAWWNNNSVGAGSVSASHNNFNWMNRRTAAAVSHIAYNNAGVVTIAASSVVATTGRDTTTLGILYDQTTSFQSTLACGMPVEALFVGGALTDPEYLNYDNALTTYLGNLRYVAGLFASGNYTVPAGITELFVECFGGGGGGRGYANATATNTGGGGAGGAYAASVIPVTPGAIIPFLIGAAGAVGSGGGGAGGDTSWNSNQVLAKGGGGAGTTPTAAAVGGQASASIGTIKYNGGNGGLGGTVLATSTGSGGSGAGALGAGINGINGASGIAVNTRSNYNMLGPGCPGYSLSNAGNSAGIQAMLGSGGGGARRTTSTRNGGIGGQGYIRLSAPRIY